MKLWYYEEWSDDVLFSIRANKIIYSAQSPYQKIDIFESDDYGRFLTLDGLLMVTERDEFIYHEMMVHPAFSVNHEIKKVLVIGGGDGGCVRELVRYKQITHIDMVEIDEWVVEASKKHLPTLSKGLDDHRVHLHFEDGIHWVKNIAPESYDLILVDSTDPIGPGEVLFTTNFYQACYRALRSEGILINQQISPIFDWDKEVATGAHQRIKAIFPKAHLYYAHIPTYASGLSLFGFASKTLDPIDDAKFHQWRQLQIKTNYYNTDLHVGAFMLSNEIVALFRDQKVGKSPKEANKILNFYRDFMTFRRLKNNDNWNQLDLWFTEKWSEDTAFRIKIDRRLHGGKCALGQFEIFENRDLGRFLVIDDFLMLTERDEFIYHEMMIHPALCVNPLIKKVLVIGGGHGGCMRELVRYPQIEAIDLVEIDEAVVDACRQYLPEISVGLSDPRVKIYYEDAATWILKQSEKIYDLIIVERADPIRPEEGLFTRYFYQQCDRLLTESGMMINQCNNSYFEQDAKEVMKIHEKIKEIFPITSVYQAHIPTYPSGHWLFGFASKSLDPIKDADFDRWQTLKLQTKYYNPNIHHGAFALPTYVRTLLTTSISKED